MDTVLGCDVSHWQGEIDWSCMKPAGAHFVFVKVSQGNWRDARFAVNWQGARDAGLLRGGYMFYDYRQSPAVNLDTFRAALEDDPGELPPAVDIEPISGVPMPSQRNMIAALEPVIKGLADWRGRAPLVYSNPATWFYLRPLPQWLADCPLWIAHYGVSNPSVPSEFGDWRFWQWTDRMDGPRFGTASKQLDGDYWQGSLDQLLAWAGVVKPAPEPEPEPQPEPQPEPRPVPPPPVLTLDEMVRRLWEAHPELHDPPKKPVRRLYLPDMRA